MCGISGIVSLKQGASVDRTILENMNQQIAHRGPDADGFFVEGCVGLGHRRLSIIDVAAGQQPMLNPQQDLVIVFNGEIYNYQAINQELRDLGYSIQTQSDTETILLAYQEWGVACLDKLNGMFAFALFDKQQQTLFFARDRIGEKPLYYSLLPSGDFIFASELKALKAHPDFDFIIDPRAVEDFMTFGYVPEPKSFYRDTYKLASGHYMTLDLSKSTPYLPQPTQYWDVDWQAPEQAASENEIIEQLREKTAARMMSEVPLGAFLSGGVDSSAIVAMMAQSSQQAINTIAVGFDEPEVNESEFAQQVADRYQSNHHLEIVDHNSFETIEQLADMYDEPFADSSALPTFKVCEAARKQVTVCLSGDGGDELFVGYRRYRLHAQESRVRRMLPLALRKPVFGLLGKLYPKLDWAPRFLRAKTTFQSLALSDSQAYLHSVSKLRADQRDKLYSDSFKQELNGYSSGSVFEQLIAGKSFADPVKEAQYLDLKTWMPGDILVKVDRASMANSLEVRVPMLDPNFINWAFSIPLEDKLKGSNGKANLKKALEQHLPHDCMYREKMGFSIPLAQWLRGPLRERVRQSLSRPSFVAAGLFDSSKVNELIRQHQAASHNHADALWSLMILSDVIENDRRLRNKKAEA